MSFKNYRNRFVVFTIVSSLFLIASSSNLLSQNNKKFDIQNRFIASGYIGDGEYDGYIKLDGACTNNPHSKPTCIKITYKFGSQRWGGIYWQNKPDNWGNLPGKNFSKKGFTKVTFWAKGESGNETVEFKSGGIYNASKKFRDSYEESTGRTSLSQEWTKYEIDLDGVDLSSVIGGFCWVASKDFNSQDEIIFYLDDIYFE